MAAMHNLSKPALSTQLKPLFLLLVWISIALIETSCISGKVASTANLANSEGLKEINGTQIFYKTMGKGAPLFVVHGRSGSHRYFLPGLAPLADHYQLVFYDQRGTGSSDGKLDLKAISIDQFVEDMEALRSSFGLEKIALMGHSWGSVFALAYTMKYPEHVDKLILVDPLPVNKTFLTAQSQTIQQRFASLSQDAQQKLNSTCRSATDKLSPEVRDECSVLNATFQFYDPAKVLTMDASSEANTTKNATTVESLLTASYNRNIQAIDTALKTIQAPTLILHGDFDPIPVASSQYIQQQIPAAQLVVIEQSGHFPFIEQPAKFVASVDTFMGQ